MPAAPVLGLVSTVPESSTSKSPAQAPSKENKSSREHSGVESDSDTNAGSKSRSKSKTDPKSKAKSESDQDADIDSEEPDTTSKGNSKALSKQKSKSSSNQEQPSSTKQKPKLNWIYVDRSTCQLKYGPRSEAKKHIIGSWDWTDDEQGITLDDAECLVAVEESRGGYGWAVYWDEKDDRLKDLNVGKEKRVLRCSLERRLVVKKRVRGLDESDED